MERLTNVVILVAGLTAIAAFGSLWESNRQAQAGYAHTAYVREAQAAHYNEEPAHSSIAPDCVQAHVYR